MSDAKPSWPTRIAYVTIPPALALVAIFFCSRYDAGTRSQIAGTDSGRAEESSTASQTSDENSPIRPPEWFTEGPEKRHEWENAKSIDVAMASRAVEAANDIYTPPQGLIFNRLEGLTPDVARVLSQCRHDLAFPKLKRITAETAAALSRHEGGLSETGLNADCLGLTGLQELPANVAVALASRQSGALWLGSAFHPLPTLTTDAANALSRYQGRSMRICVRELDPSARDALQSYSGQLLLEEFPRK